MAENFWHNNIKKPTEHLTRLTLDVHVQQIHLFKVGLTSPIAQGKDQW